MSTEQPDLGYLDATVALMRKIEAEQRENIEKAADLMVGAIAADRLITVAVDANITPELRQEGLAREIVRRVQALRKDAGFNIEDRITTYYDAGAQEELQRVMEAWGGYIRAETLSTELIAGQPPAEVYQETQKVDGVALTLGVKRNS